MFPLRKTLCSPGASTSRENILKPDKGSRYFTAQGSVRTCDGTFHYYARGDNGPVIVGIHGGGYSGLTWSLFAEEITNLIQCRVLAIDLRGHGMTNVKSEDMSLVLLAKDIAAVVKLIYNEHRLPIFLLGHSLGGAVAVEVAPLLPIVAGVALIDAVEGIAIDLFPITKHELKARPTGFTSIEAAIEWSKGRLTGNLQAAKVSMPGQIKNAKTGKLAAFEIETTEPSTSRGIDVIEETSEEKTLPFSKLLRPQYKYDWRIDLLKTEKYWTGWYTGLSQKFLDLPHPKVLIISSMHGLDITLTVGEMEDKFELKVLPRCGPAIHEDWPDQVADIIAQFIVKQGFGKPTPLVVL